MTTIAHNWQLSFDFQFSPKAEKALDTKENRNFQYYPSDSTILKDIFSIKVNFQWRSYILKWRYRIATIKAFWDMEDRRNSIWFVELQKILAYRWLIYSVAFVSKQEKLKLTKIVEKILSNAAFNQNLETA